MFKKPLFYVILFAVFATASIAFAAWSGATRLTTNTTHDAMPDLIMENDVTHMVYQNAAKLSSLTGSTYYRKRAGTGAWSSPIKIASNTDLMEGYASVAAFNGKAHVVYGADDGNDIELIYRTNKSGAFSTSTKITNNSMDEANPVIAGENGKFFVAFERMLSSTNTEIYLSRNLNGSWSSTPLRLTSLSGHDIFPTIFVQDGKVHIAWINLNASTFTTTLKYAVLAGNTLSTPKTLTRSKTFMMNPSLAMNGSLPFIVYDYQNSASNSNGIGFSYISSGSWITKDVTNISMNTAADGLSRMAIADNGEVRVLWTRLSYSNLKNDVWQAALSNVASSWIRSNLTNTSTKNELSGDIAVNSDNKSHILYMIYDGDYEIVSKNQL